MKNLVFGALSSVALLLCAAPAFAAGKPHVVLHLSSELVAHTANGVRFEAIARPLRAGDEMHYTIVARNEGSAAALHVRTDGHIPAHTTYVAGSARAPRGAATFSLDGKHWSSEPMLRIAHGKGHQLRPAPVALYQGIQFTAAVIPPHASVTYSYDVRVNGTQKESR